MSKKIFERLFLFKQISPSGLGVTVVTRSFLGRTLERPTADAPGEDSAAWLAPPATTQSTAGQAQNPLHPPKKGDTRHMLTRMGR